MSRYLPGNPFNPQTTSGLAGHCAVRTLLLILLTVFVSACGGPSGSVGGVQPTTISTLSPRLFILGTQVDMGGNLRIFAHGLDQAGNPITLADYEMATVTVGGVPYAVSVPGPGDVTVKAIDPNEPLMSLALVTDYSFSISDADLDRIAVVNDTILTSLPPIFEAAVFNFSDTVELREDWTDILADLQTAVQVDNGIVRNNTALYEALGTALERPLPMAMDGDGLIERCRPIRMMVVHTDGQQNVPGMYDKPELLMLIEDSRTIPIMLGTLDANAIELSEFAGERGAFVFDVDLAGIEAEVQDWVDSFAQLVEFNLTPATGFDPGPVQIDLGSLTIMVEPPYDQTCFMP